MKVIFLYLYGSYTNYRKFQLLRAFMRSFLALILFEKTFVHFFNVAKNLSMLFLLPKVSW
jgi:hypothetical protein